MSETKMKRRESMRGIVKVVVDSERVESLMQENNSTEIIKLGNFYKEKGVLEDMMGFRYCMGKANLFHAIVKLSNSNTIIEVFDFVISTLGLKYFLHEVNSNLDNYARNVLIIAAKHQDMSVVLNLMENYDLSPNFYCRHNQMSALSYVLKRKKYNTALRLLANMDPSELSEEQRTWIQKDLDVIRKEVSADDLIKEDWLVALTLRHLNKARKTKYRKLEYVERASFEKNRLRQVMRHIAFQLYLRWSNLLRGNTFDDVQIMYVEKRGDKKNPYPQPCLFIACTPAYLAEYIQQDLKSKSFQDMLLADYDPNDGLAEVRSQRYRKKLKTRIWGNDDLSKTTKESKKLGELLKSDTKRVQKIVKTKKGIKLPFFEYTERVAYLVTPDSYSRKGMHAEEVLCDIATYLNTHYSIRHHIYGKARPCVSCVSRMELSNITGYSKHPGFLWLSAIQQQTADVAKHSVELLFDLPTYVSYFSQELLETPAYDTASDSE